ncbi:PSD1 and planctomycete cytochrome C domain-containing protein [Tundrisphaera sp. TA3]|uniref:PSD1 and planctomycete cytochrome C domain-containing protein n=1 Tax=Tundrisphaera sp. TA3 TaxID=3435775 RepID=UPI003EBE080B
MRRVIIRGGLLFALFAGALRASDGPKVGELLVDRCLSCHSADSKKGKLDLSRRAAALAGGETGPAIEPHKSADSLLFERVESGEMPPSGALKPEEIAALRAWIDSGAAYEVEPLQPRRAGPDWWSLRPIRRPAVPEVRDPAWVRNPIDAFVLAGLEKAQLRPAPEAERAALIRRVSFDLIGLPPSPEEVREFVADDRPDAYERLVDRLLESPHHGERWGRHWLDVVRFAESHGYETNQLRPNAWPYRDYVIRAFNRDTPFARFVEEQLAGDALPDADWLGRAATGFLVGGSHDVVTNAIPEAQLQQRVDDLDDILAATSTAFLGLTAQCARCHDHKFDPIRQADYYRLQSLLAGIQHADRALPAPDADRRAVERAEAEAEVIRIDRELDEAEPLAHPELATPSRPPVSPRRNVERFEPARARAVRFTTRATNNGIEPCIDELEVWTAGPTPRNVALAASGGKPLASSTYPGSDIHRLEHANDGRVGNGRSWISAVNGQGWLQVEWPEAESVDRVVWGRDREGKYQDRTPTDYLVELETEPGRWQTVASSADRARSGEGFEESPGHRALRERRDPLRKRIAELSPTISVYAGTFAQPGPTRILRRGDPTQPQAPVVPGGILAVPPGLELPADAPEVDRRRALARWIADPANPLPARVHVNRAWQNHFGRGIVATPSDFGFNGVAPSHPELLDWLASEFLANGGRLKPIHRLIVLSAAYRQSSRPDASGLARDHDDRLLWRFPPRRLEAEEIRDAILAASGSLDTRMGGPGYSLWEPNTNYVAVFTPRAELGPDAFRRMVYQFKPRSQPDPTFGVFDCPDGGLVAPRRNVSTTPLQALNLLNSRFMLDQSARLAARVEREVGADFGEQAERAFVLTLGRSPTEAEWNDASMLIRDHGGSTLARALLNSNEFLHVP